MKKPSKEKTMTCYELSANSVTWNMYVQYTLNMRATPAVVVRKEYQPFWCKGCDRVDPAHIQSLASLDVFGYKNRFSLLAETIDGYTVCNEDFFDVVNDNKIKGIRFVPIKKQSGSYVLFADSFLACSEKGADVDDVCSACGRRPEGVYGTIREIEMPTRDKIYGLSLKSKNHNVNGRFVFNETVAALLEHHGADCAVREMKGVKWIKSPQTKKKRSK